MLDRGISLPLETQKQIEEGDRFEKGLAIQFPIYGDRIKQGLSNLPEEQRESIARYLTELCFDDFYTRAGLDLQTRELLILCVLSALGGTDVQIKSHAAGNLKVGNSRETLYWLLLSAFHWIPKNSERYQHCIYRELFQKRSESERQGSNTRLGCDARRPRRAQCLLAQSLKVQRRMRQPIS
jgi:alkylhydroperoxidase/carboxymuconolactone decarboxylase family protein YurZ